MVILHILIGVSFLIAGLIYLYNIKVVFTINHFFKNRVFNDAKAMVEHKKVGLFLILVSIIFLYIGLNQIQIRKNRQTAEPAKQSKAIKKN